MRSTAVLLVCSVWAVGCGNYSQPAARDLATEKSCDWYAQCDQIGPGKVHATRDDCEIGTRAFWNAAWPVATCDGKIRPQDLDTCLLGIQNTACSNALDFVNTVLNKCGQQAVCQG